MIQDLLVAEEIDKNILSVPNLNDMGAEALFTISKARVCRNSEIVMSAYKQDVLMWLKQ